MRFVPIAVLAMLGLCAFARADQPSREWAVDVRTLGTYKIQVEHTFDQEPRGGEVTYAVTVANETRTRSIGLIANRPFVPLVIEIPGPTQLRVVVKGLGETALRRTRVDAYRADSVPPSQYFDPELSLQFEGVNRIREILELPASAIDLAKVKLTIDKMIDPTIDVEINLRAIDAMVAKISSMPGFGSSSTSKLLALKRFIYETGAWNGNRPFEYDLDDPFGSRIRNKLLSNYLVSRKGNCITMPILVVALGQRLGLEMTLSTAPKHLLAKFRRDEGAWINLETTSGANPARDVWIRQQMPMTDEALAKGVYLQALSKKESVAVMSGVLAEHFLRQREYRKAIAVVNLALEYYPKNVAAMTTKGVAYGRLANKQYIERYPTPDLIPVNERGYFAFLLRNNRAWFANAEALGWREESETDRADYLEQVRKAQQDNLKN